MRRARWLGRVADIDFERPGGGGRLKIRPVIEEPAVIVRILAQRGVPARAPPGAPARELALDHAA